MENKEVLILTPTGSKSSLRKFSIGGRIRSVRVPDDLWGAAAEKAAKEGIPLSIVIRQLLEQWVNEK